MAPTERNPVPDAGGVMTVLAQDKVGGLTPHSEQESENPEWTQPERNPGKAKEGEKCREGTKELCKHRQRWWWGGALRLLLQGSRVAGSWPCLPRAHHRYPEPHPNHPPICIPARSELSPPQILNFSPEFIFHKELALAPCV